MGCTCPSCRTYTVTVPPNGQPFIVPSEAPTLPDANPDLEIIQAALLVLSNETRFEALGRIALEALERLRKKG